jgi:O-antigen biosynthesis protein
MTKLIKFILNSAHKASMIFMTTLSAVFMLSRYQNHLKLSIKAWQILKNQGFSALWQGLGQLNNFTLSYDRWIQHHDTLKDDDFSAINSHISALPWHPIISIIMPTYNSPEQWLRKAIESVRSQLYPYWELCIADDASTNETIYSILEEYCQSDERIRVVYRKRNGHISAASNSALDMAQGEFIALLDHDDELPPHALYMVAVALDERPYLDMIYSDEDKINVKGQRFDPYFKPDWNPALLTGQNVVSHLGIFRTELVRSTGGFREGYEGSQDWDLALRISELIPDSNIHHLPYVLYHWRTITGSSAIGRDEKSYITHARKNLLSDHLERTGRKGDVTVNAAGSLRIGYPVPSPPSIVSIIIHTQHDLHLLRRCIDSIMEKTLYVNYEIIVVDGRQPDDPEMLNYVGSLKNSVRLQILRYNILSNYSTAYNLAIEAAKGDYICLMNDNIEVISEGWLNEMLSHAYRPEIGAVGAMLYFPNDTIHHAGIVLGQGCIAQHLYVGHPRGTRGYKNRAALTQNLSAVTAACMVVKTAIYKEVGGMDEKNLPIEYNDVDFCLKIEEHGYRNLWTPFAEFYHHENATRGYRDTIEKNEQHKLASDYMHSRWGSRIENDPAYNANLTLNNSWPYPAQMPRIKKPWKS